MILVVGATGVLGFEICRKLRARGLPVRALVRRGTAREQAIAELGVEIVRGDLRIRATLDDACRGIAAVVSTATAMGSTDKSLTLRAVDRDGQLNLVAAAAAAGVEQFVFVSVSPTLQPPAPLVRYKREVEQAVRVSGMQWTILQPTVFMEIWLSEKVGWDHHAARATTFGPGTGPMQWIAVDSVAEYAVRSLEDPRLANQTVPLGGPDAVTPNDVVRLFETLSGRQYRVRRVPTSVLRLVGPVLSIFNEQAGSAIAMGVQSVNGDRIDSPIQREIGLPLRTLREHAEQVIGATASARAAS